MSGTDKQGGRDLSWPVGQGTHCCHCLSGTEANGGGSDRDRDRDRNRTRRRKRGK